MADEQSLGGNSSLYDEAQRAGRESQEPEFVIANFSVLFHAPTSLNNIEGGRAYRDAQLAMAKWIVHLEDIWQVKHPYPGFHISFHE